MAEWSIAAVLKTAIPLYGIGGSNPSPSAKLCIYVNDYIKYGIGLAVTAVIFLVLWRMGYVRRLSKYVQDTQEELKKCTWPTRDELKGHTAVVMVSIALLGLYVVGIDFILTLVVSVLNNLNKVA